MTSDLQIYKSYMSLIAYSNDLVRKYPKSEKFALVQEIKKSLYNGLRFLMYAIKVYNNQEKLKHLNDFDIELRLLKIHIRLSHKYQYISTQNYATWSEQITDICNMLGGWINSCVKK